VVANAALALIIFHPAMAAMAGHHQTRQVHAPMRANRWAAGGCE
jgi:hypothetical protein